MKIVNRGFLILRTKAPFYAWASTIDEQSFYEEGDVVEPSIYLITDDFLEDEPMIEQHFKNIFENELLMITEDEGLWPEKRSIELFNEWFTVELGSSVFDCEKADLKSENF
jgi:hypothetical protein